MFVMPGGNNASELYNCASIIVSTCMVQLVGAVTPTHLITATFLSLALLMHKGLQRSKGLRKELFTSKLAQYLYLLYIYI